MIVEDLKRSILDTVLFKKVNSNNQESASDLLNKINIKRNELIKSGICKNKILDEISDDEITKIIPENWKWVRFNNLYNFIDYRGKTPKKVDCGIRLIGSANIKNGYLDFSIEDKYITEKEFETRKSRGLTQKGDILFVTEGGSMGNVCINTLDEICSCGQRVITFQQFANNTLVNKYYMYLFMSDFFKSKLRKKSTGSAAIGIKGDKLKEFVVPLPPKKEQQEIVDKIEELFAKLDELKPIEDELNVLKHNFSLNIKKSILNKVYKENDEVDKVLLSEIIKFENLKKGKCGDYNYLDVRYLRSKMLPQKKSNGKFVLSGTYAILMDGENSGELFYIDEDGYLGSTLKSIKISSRVLDKYLVYYLYLKKEYFKSNKRGAAIPHLNKKLFFSSKIYLPNSVEQQKIVDKIEQLLPLCNDIEKLVNR